MTAWTWVESRTSARNIDLLPYSTGSPLSILFVDTNVCQWWVLLDPLYLAVWMSGHWSMSSMTPLNYVKTAILTFWIQCYWWTTATLCWCRRVVCESRLYRCRRYFSVAIWLIPIGPPCSRYYAFEVLSVISPTPWLSSTVQYRSPWGGNYSVSRPLSSIKSPSSRTDQLCLLVDWYSTIRDQHIGLAVHWMLSSRMKPLVTLSVISLVVITLVVITLAVITLAVITLAVITLAVITLVVITLAVITLVVVEDVSLFDYFLLTWEVSATRAALHSTVVQLRTSYRSWWIGCINSPALNGSFWHIDHDILCGSPPACTPYDFSPSTDVSTVSRRLMVDLVILFRDLGIWIDTDVNIRTHVQRTVSRCFSVLHHLRLIRRLIYSSLFHQNQTSSLKKK